MRRWIRQAGGNGGKQAFLTRLAAEGIEESSFQCLFASVDEAGTDEPLPEWSLSLQEILAFLPLPPPEESESEVHGEHEPLLSALRPFLLSAEKSWPELPGGHSGGTCLPPSVKAELLTALARRLAWIMDKTYQTELHRRLAVRNPLLTILGRALPRETLEAGTTQLTADLLAGGWVELLLAYPVLARRLALATTDWLASTGELLDRLHRDSRELERLFGFTAVPGGLSRIETDLSDPHNGGRTVAILHWKTGERLVYKPRGGGIDLAWCRWIAWVEGAGLPCFPVPKVLDRGDHCWVEYMSSQALTRKEDAELYYRRAGVLLCLLYVLGANDFHMENIIARGAYPVLVDLETLLVHSFKPFEQEGTGSGATREAMDRMMDSVLHIGLLPIWMTDGRGKAEDISGLTGFGPAVKNLPVWEGHPVAADEYHASVCHGFEQAYAFVLQHQEELLGEESPLKLFDGLLLRTVLRPTRVYGDLAERLRHPRSMRDGLEYSLELERMAAAYFLQEPGDQLVWRWNCFVSEAEALGRGDVPIFYGHANACALLDAKGLIHPEFFQETALERCRRIISRCNEADLRVQLQFIQAALAMKKHALAAHAAPVALTDGVRESANRPQFLDIPEAGEVPTSRLLAEADAIYRQIMKWRLQTDDGDFTWISLQMEPSSRKMVLGPINHSFYDGAVGLGVFFAALARVTRKEKLKEQTLATIASWRRTLRDTRNPFPVHRLNLGLGNGVAGFVRGLAVMGDYLAEEQLWDDVELLCTGVRDEQIEEDRQLDVFGGAAGLILALAQLPPSRRLPEMLVLADKCGRHLLAKRVQTASGYRAWDNGLGYAPLCGAAHGAAGIANALLQLSLLTGDQVYTEAAREGITYENELFDSAVGNWPDLRYQEGAGEEAGQKAFMSGWCSGAPGIGLARLSSLPQGGEMTSFMEQDVERALRFTISHAGAVGDTLCCGKSAMIDFLLVAGDRLGREELLEHARARAEEMIGHKQATGSYRFTGSEGGVVFNPALFHGLAGIGYTLLRCFAPGEVVSLLQ